MSIPVECKSCGHAFKAKEKYAGRRGGCPKCGATVHVPAIKQDSTTSTSGESGLSIQEDASSTRGKSPTVTLACGDCGRRFKAQLGSSPRDAVCPGCGVELTIPAKSKPKPKPVSVDRAASSEGNQPSNDLWDDLPGGDASSGFSLDELPAASTPAVQAPQLPKMKSKKRRSSISFDDPQSTLKAVGLALAALAAVAFLGLGLVSGNVIGAFAGLSRVGVLVCYVTVVVRMCQHGRYGLAIFSGGGWLLGIILVFGVLGTAIAKASETGQRPDVEELGTMIVVVGFGGILVILAGLTTYIVGWVKSNEWRLGGVMMAWSLCVIISLILRFSSAAAEPVLADNSNVEAESLRVPPSRLPAAAAGNSETNREPAKTGPHVKLGRAVYIVGEDRITRFPEYGVSVDFTFDPERTESRSQYFWVIENSEGRSEMRLMERGQGTLQGSLSNFPSIGREKKQPTNWQCWIEIEPSGARGGSSRSRVSEVVSMRSASKLPPPKEYVPLPGANDPPPETATAQADSSNAASRSPTPPPRSMPTPPKEVDLDEALAMLASGEKQRIRTGLKWFGEHQVDEARQSEVATAIAPLLEHPDVFARMHAAEALRIWGTDEQIPQWIEALNGDHRVADLAQDALADTKDPRAAHALADMLESDRFGASEALIKMGRPAEAAVITMLEHPDSFIRAKAAEILGEIGGKDSMRALKKLARDPSAISRNAAEEAFYQIEFREKQAEKRKPSSALERVN